jgi:dolichol-phosphate mannosyltransferase
VVPLPAARTLVSLATYNERDNLEALVNGVRRHAPGADVLVTDDNSPDGTGRLADELAATRPWLRVRHRPGKLGLGSAMIGAMQEAVARGYDLLVTMDADGSHAPRHLPALLAGMRDHDVMIGSRYVPGGAVVDWPASRRWMSRAINTLCRVLMRLPAQDCSGGYRCYRVGLLRRARLDQMLSHGYSFQEELLYRCWRAGGRIGEVPIVFENRRAGSSKLNYREVARSVSVLVYLGARALFGLDRAVPMGRSEQRPARRAA